MPALFALINRTFCTAHNSAGRSLLPPNEHSRLRTHEQLGNEIGDDGFTWIMLSASTPADKSKDHTSQQASSQSSEKVIGTASAKPYQPPTPYDPKTAKIPGATSLFKRQPGTEKELEAHAGLPKWEILVTVVDPDLQGRGLAAQLMESTVGEIRRRVAAESVVAEEDGWAGERGKIVLLLSTMQELNEGYYAKRKWTATGVRRFPPGTMGSRDGFGVIEMMKVVDA
jgi:predicted GNAT family acetyltransferase